MDNFLRPVGHFECLLSAYEYIGLLEDTLKQEVADVEGKLATVGLSARTLEYFRVVRHNLAQCEQHIAKSRRLLNNLRRLENIG